jgi:hypothetical protein
MFNNTELVTYKGNERPYISRRKKKYGRALAEAVSRRLPISMARIRAQVKSCVVYSGHKVSGEVNYYYYFYYYYYCAVSVIGLVAVASAHK